MCQLCAFISRHVMSLSSLLCGGNLRMLYCARAELLLQLQLRERPHSPSQCREGRSAVSARAVSFLPAGGGRLHPGAGPLHERGGHHRLGHRAPHHRRHLGVQDPRGHLHPAPVQCHLPQGDPSKLCWPVLGCAGCTLQAAHTICQPSSMLLVPRLHLHNVAMGSRCQGAAASCQS